MLPDEALARAVADLPLVSATGPWTRVVGYHLLQGPPPSSPPGSPPQPLWPGGPAVRGARFTPKGSFGTIYLATDPVTALLEVTAIFRNPHAPASTLRTPPWAVFAVEGILEDVLDLTDPPVIEALDTSLDELSGNWRFSQDLHLAGEGPLPPTQRLGRAAQKSGRISALRYHSAKNPGNGSSYAIFSDRLVPGSVSYLEVFDPRKLIQQRLP